MYFETQKLSVGYHRRHLIEDIDIGIWQGGILCRKILYIFHSWHQSLSL